jgi:uncharacterized protein (TIGR02145 family)
MKLPSKCNSILSSSDTDCAIEISHRGICPSGWHVPSVEDWTTLKSYVSSNSECSSCADKHLKATSGWNSDGNGLDTYGFSALPGGYGNSINQFYDYNVGYGGYWWSAREYGSSNAFSLEMNDSDNTNFWGANYKSRVYSVRCLQD